MPIYGNYLKNCSEFIKIRQKKSLGLLAETLIAAVGESLGLSGDNRMRRQVLWGSIAVCAPEWFLRGSSAVYKRKGIRKISHLCSIGRGNTFSDFLLPEPRNLSFLKSKLLSLTFFVSLFRFRGMLLYLSKKCCLAMRLAKS